MKTSTLLRQIETYSPFGPQLIMCTIMCIRAFSVANDLQCCTPNIHDNVSSKLSKNFEFIFISNEIWSLWNKTISTTAKVSTNKWFLRTTMIFFWNSSFIIWHKTSEIKYMLEHGFQSNLKVKNKLLASLNEWC